MSASEDICIRLAGSEDMARLNEGLAQLSHDLGDVHSTDIAAITRACTGKVPACHGLLAIKDAATVGVALMSPVYSTTRGCSGAYISDLWVSSPMRATGLGRRLVFACSEFAKEKWNAYFLKLIVYEDNPNAQAFYNRMGFQSLDRDRVLILETKNLSQETP